MFVPDEPRFDPRWFRAREPERPAWLGDPGWVPPGPKWLYARARSGLWAIAREEFRDGATALIPAYVPRSVVSALRAGGLEVHYYPIEPSLRLPAAAVRERIESVEPDALLFVHYFGFPDPAFPELAAAARAGGAVVLEDCARSLFGRDREGALLGTVGRYALFSLYKVLAVPNGGLVVAADHDAALPDPVTVRSEYRDAAADLLVAACRAVGVPPPGHASSDVGVATTDPGAARRPDVDHAAPIAGPGRLSRLGLRATDPGTVLARRRRRYADARAALAAVDGVEVLTPRLYDGACPFGVAIRFPAGPEARDASFERLRARGLPSQRLRWPLRADEQDPERYEGARALRQELLVVPTHHQVPAGTGSAVADAVAEALGS